MKALNTEECSYGHTLRLLAVSARILSFVFKGVGFSTCQQVQCKCSLPFYLFGFVMLQGLLHLFSFLLLIFRGTLQ